MRRFGRREFLKRLLLAASGIALGGTSACRQSQTGAPTAGPEDVVSITILHVNDLHGALRPKQTKAGETGGAANLVGLIDRERASAPGPVLLLDAGDALQGTYISNLNRGQAVVEVMNAAGFDAATLGNHEFDWGQDVLWKRIDQARYPYLAANLELCGDGLPEGVQPYVVLDADGVRIAVLGLTYHDLSSIVMASAIQGLCSLPPAETVRRYLPELQEKADLVIVLSHLGIAGDRALARAVPELPLIIGGHSHVAPSGGERVGDTVIVHAGAYGERLGLTVVRYDLDQRKIVEIDAGRETIAVHGGTPNAQVAAIVDRWGAEADRRGNDTVGQAVRPLRARRSTETALGNLITDAMRAADLGDGRIADVAMHNDGGIRADLDAGPITFAELYAVLPFDNILVGLDLTGEQVKAMLEDGIGSMGSEIQVSGLRFSYRMGGRSGRRVTQVEVGGQPLDPACTYRVVTINYLHTHPQYADSLGKGTQVTYGPLCLDAVVQYLRAHSPVDPVVEGRIQGE